MKHLRNRHFFLSDTMSLAVMAYVSYVLRLERFDLTLYWPGFAIFALTAVVITPLVFRRTGIYSRYWRYASVNELVLLAGSVTIAAILSGMLSTAIARMIPGHSPIPRSIPFIFLLLALAATASPRLALRLATRYHRRGGPATWQTVLIMGAGDAGTMIVRELRNNPQLGMEVLGFLDDDPGKHRVRIHGVPVLGDRHMIPTIVHQYNVQLVIIAMPTAPGKVIREIVGICEQVGVKTKIIPGIYELLNGTVSVNQLRNVQIEDLLRREPIQTDIAAVRQLIRGKRVLVTGGGGSIGSELCRQVLRCDPAELVLVGHGENSIFEICSELARQLGESDQARGAEVALEVHGYNGQSEVIASAPASRLRAVIADIRCPARIHHVFEQYRPEIVFHAAAHKHVPLMELNPAEAITNNVLGTRNLLEAALAVDVRHFVMLSSDKAVNPTNVMGASKRAAELLVHQAARKSGRAYAAVRFGNVLGSRGSVVLTFKQQIAAGGPVTVTHPEMRRYFMTIPEAVQLVLQAAALGRGGEVFVLDMGEPVKIVDLARDLIELSGLEVGKDIDIVFTGVRPGEKLFEELFVPGEHYERTHHEKIFIASNASNFVPPDLNEMTDALAAAAELNDKDEIVRCLQALLPEFQSAARAEDRKAWEAEYARSVPSPYTP